MKNKPNLIFWVRDNEIIADIEKIERNININPQIWNTISNMFSLNYNETQMIIEQWLENYYYLGGLTPYSKEYPGFIMNLNL